MPRGSAALIGDFCQPYYATIIQEENRTRRYCWICGYTNFPRWKLEICDYCGNVCANCKEWHDKAAPSLHQRKKYKLQVISDHDALNNQGDRASVELPATVPPRSPSPKRKRMKQMTLMGVYKSQAKSAKLATKPKT